jgi:hypothetical protein
VRKRMITAWLCGIALIGTCFAGSRSLRDELKQTTAQSGLSLAEFNRGKLIRWGLPNGREDTEIPFAIGHSWSNEGMLSPDGTLAAFPYWDVDPCPSWKSCDVQASRHFYLAITHIDGSGITEYPRIVLPSEMCWTHDNSKLAMVARLENTPKPRLVVLHLDSGEADPVADADTVAVTPQCWSPDGKQLVYFAGEKKLDGPGAIRILDTTTHVSRELLRGGPDCDGSILCASPYPTWSPDGEWIAYLQKKTYWAIRPSGQGTKRLFRRPNALSPLQWSPDMHYAIYADCCALRDTFRCMCEIGRIHLRRLADNSDLEVFADGFQDMYIPRWTWIQTKDPN